jgi:predicted signal transduction protein with EAL and GGDEF domain
MPFSELKLDRSLISDLRDNDETRVIAELLIDLSRRLNISVCAEGMESRSNLEILRSMGCDAAQGFYFTEPRRLADITPLLRYGNGSGTPVELVMPGQKAGTGDGGAVRTSAPSNLRAPSNRRTS